MPDPATARVKALIRRQVRQSSMRLSAEDRATASRALCAQVLQLETWRAARCVLLFAPMPDEPDVMELMESALSAGKSVCFPRFDAASGTYQAAAIAHPHRDLVPGHFGITEPAAGCPVMALNRLDFVVVPGVAFTAAGWRLGRGKGYYDRLLAQVHGTKCGACFDWQLVPELPLEPHDVRLNCIVTPARCYPAVWRAG